MSITTQKRLVLLTSAILLPVIAAHHPALAVILLFGVLACLAPAVTVKLGAAPDTNDIAAQLNLNEILDAAIMAFKRVILPLRMFSTVFRNVQLKGNNTVEVPYYPLQGIGSKDFAGSYDFSSAAGSQTQTREITVNKRKYQALQFTGAELARFPMLNAQLLGELRGAQLAYDVINDILSLIVSGNFPAVCFTGAASTIDSDSIIDIRTSVGKNQTTLQDGTTVVNTPWPTIGRGLMVNPDYDGALLKDNAFKAAYSLGTDVAIREGTLPRIFGFNYADSAGIPANGQNLVGFAAYMSAILTAFSPIEPPKAVRAVMTEYEIVTDPETDISLEYRVWGNPTTDTEMRVIECNYGYAKGEGQAIQRMISA